MKNKILLIVLVICFGKSSFSQNISNEGKDFWVGYGLHQFMELPAGNNSQEMVLYFSARQNANVKVTAKGQSATQITNYFVPANTAIASNFMPKINGHPNDTRMYDANPSFGGFGGEKTWDRSIHIESDVPIVAYAHIFGSVSSGATMLLPVDSWGNNYFSINSRQLDAAGLGFNWVYTIASQDNTLIRITPGATSRLGKPAGVPFTISLNKGQIYQIVGQADNLGNGVELTGTKVESIANSSGQCYPIAVFAGSSRTRGEDVPCGSGSGRDNDMQQCYPTQAWGKRYLTAPFSTSNGSGANPNLNANIFMTHVYKIVVKDPTTIVKRNGVVLTGLVNNLYYKFSSNSADYLESDKPIMVGQFMSGSTICNPGSHGDPEMVFLSPIEQSIKDVGFYRNTREVIYSNYVTVIVPTNGLSSLRIDNSNVFNHTYAHPNLSGYSIAIKGWKSAQAQTKIICDSGFTAITYGLGSAESYAYNAGTFLNNLNLRGAIRNNSDTSTNVAQHDYTCKNSPVTLSALYLYQPTNLVWDLSSLGANITPNANVVDNSPVAIGTQIIDGITYYKYSLPGTYIFNDTGTFVIPITSTHPSIENCTFSERLTYTIQVKATPKPTFSFTHSGCTTDTVYFAGNATTLNGYTNQQYLWTFPGPSTATTQNVNKLFPPGPQTVNFRTVTNVGCVGDTTAIINIQNRPTSDFNFAPLQVCENGQVTFTDNSGVSGTGPGFNWYWDFGNGNIINASTNANQTQTYPNYGTYVVKHVVRSSATCFSDTVSKPITVYAKPRVNFTFPTNCVGTNGQVLFNNTTTIPDGQTISPWAWTFNDPNANAGNPNTSTLQNPTHNFSDGTYNVNLQATSQQGCVKDTTIVVPVRVRPALSYPPLASVCINTATPFIVASTAVVTNGVPGTGVYSGPGTTTNGLFTPTQAGVGTHTIWYKFTSSSGCVDSVSQTIQVKAKPIVNFTYPTGGCLPPNGLAQFNGIANLSDGQTVFSWAWNFNDPNATGGNPNTSSIQNPTHNFIANGIYNVNLSVNSSGGCSGDTTIILNLNVKPSLAYPSLSSVCVNAAGTINVATASVTNGATGTGIYTGPGTTSVGIFTPAQAGVGTHTIWYKFTTPNGCVDSISQSILVKAKPIVNFTYPTGGCLPANGLAQFNGLANLSDGQTVNTWAWDFNDPNANAGNPNTSALQNPTHNFTANGIYNIKLTANSSGGCLGDITIQLNFNIKPSLAYPILAPVCQSVVGTISVATATVTNGATGVGVYAGPNTTSAGMFSPSGAGAGTHIIWYKFTTPNGCVDSISQTITVQPKPTASFTKTDICAGLNSTITNTSTIAAGNITSWYWDFGDATTATYTNGNPFTKSYANAGSYIVKLVATSSAGCVSDTAFQTIIVHPNPTANFSLPVSVCMPGNAVNITNQSTIAGNGTLNYSWNFGDANTSQVTNPAHIYAAIGNYTITLTTTSAFGCIGTNAKPFNAFFVKPIALFSNNKDTLCQGNDNVFTDLSTDPVGSAITNWSWSFGDGATSTIKNPTKRFLNPNTYNVTLTVTNAAGCVSNAFVKPVVVYLQPVVDAGPSFTVTQGSVVTFNANANNTTGINFNWSPSIGLSNPNILQPTHTATADRTFTLTATGQGGCTASDFMNVKVLKPLTIPNAFSPNGDGVNDRWEIENLIDYTDCVIQIYNRYGQKLQQITGYSKPWDGTVNGKPLPVATYYYIMDLKNGLDVLKGSVTIIR